MIQITKPYLPSKKKYSKYLTEIWAREHLTNSGPLVNSLELRLKSYLDTQNIHFLSNGTIAIQIAIKALGLIGEIITTPFSYIATTSSIVWEGCTPIFVDIDSETLNIDPNLIEDSITDKTTGILATHVFGNPCDIDAIQKIAEKHNLKVIYDAAHCFGSIYNGKSVFNYGDLSTTSFHATKLFHTVEGGAIFTNNDQLSDVVGYMKNFGHNGPTKFECVGINGKNSEFHAAMGHCNLDDIDTILSKRKSQSQLYSQKLRSLDLGFIKINEKSEFNFAYYPVLFNSERELLETLRVLNSNGIYPRRYFYPSLNNVKYTNGGSTPISESISKRILCLPLYHKLKSSDINKICSLITKSIIR